MITPTRREMEQDQPVVPRHPRRASWAARWTSSGRRVDVFLFLLAVVAALSYLPLNHVTGHLHVLRTALDRHVPFEPGFAIPYLLFFPVFWLTFLYAFLKRSRFRAFALAIIITYAISDVVFAFYQTYVPRPAVSGDDLFSHLVRFIYAHDRPYNGFPSEHSSSAALLAIYSVVTRQKWRWIVVAFGVVVVASTLFVKQHFLPDAAGGVMLALGVSLIVFRRLRD